MGILREVDHVLAQTYFSKAENDAFLAGVVARGLGPPTRPPARSWREVNALSIQTRGRSQREQLEAMGLQLESRHGYGLDACGSEDGPFLYLDDALFSGSRAGGDLARWIEDRCPAEATLYVVAMATHTLAEFLVRKRLREAAAQNGKQVDLQFQTLRVLENRRLYRDDSEVLWPTALPGNEWVRDYAQANHKFPFEPRRGGGRCRLFSSEEARCLLEHEFLVAGVGIRSLHQRPKDVMRPLGFSPFGLGFGSTLVTHRNCPNNAPLALWWSLGGWSPLFERRTNEHEGDAE